MADPVVGAMVNSFLGAKIDALDSVVDGVETKVDTANTKIDNLSGGTKHLVLPNGLTIPLQFIEGASNFTSSGDVYLEELITYCQDYTLGTGHQLVVPGVNIIYGSGNITIGGNGVIGATRSVVPDYSLHLKDFYSEGGTGEESDGPNSGVGGDGLGYGAGGGGGSSHTSISGGFGGKALSYGGNSSGRSAGGGGAGKPGGDVTSTSLIGGRAGLSNQAVFIILGNNIAINEDINLKGMPGEDGNGDTDDSAGGGGGGFGGSVYVFGRTSITIDTGVTIDVSGGDGGDSYVSATRSRGGGGGGGFSGKIHLQAPTITNNGTLAYNAGAGGSSVGTGTAGGDGSDGASIAPTIIEGSVF